MSRNPYRRNVLLSLDSLEIRATPAVLAIDDSYTVTQGQVLVADDPDGTVTPAEPNDDGVLANDVDPTPGAVLTVTAIPTPPIHGTLVINNLDGTFTYTPTDPAFTGVDTFEYEVTSDNGTPGDPTDDTTDTALVTITITAADPPTFTSPATFDIDENETFVGTVEADDPAGTTVTYEITGGDDAALFVIDADTGELSFIDPPDFEDPQDATGDNVYEVEVTATAETGQSEVQMIMVTVQDVDEAPEFISPDTFEVDENETIVGVVEAVDPEGTDVTYEITGGDDAALFVIDADTGELSFIDPPDFEDPQDATGDNNYQIEVTATDATGQEAVQEITVVVLDVNEPPTITSDDMVTVPENTTAVITVTADDPDEGDVLTFSVSGGADAALFEIDADTGELSFIDPPDFEDPQDATGDNVYEVEILAADETGQSATQLLLVTVTDVDERPEIVSPDTFTVPEGTTLVGTVEAIDPEGERVVYVISGGADRELFEIDRDTGVLRFRAAPDFEDPQDATGDNVYEVEVTAVEAGVPSPQASIPQLIRVTVTDVEDENRPPMITSNGGGAVAALSIPEGTTAVTTVTAVDPDGDPLTFSIVGGADAALFSIDATSGQLRFISPPDFEDPQDSTGDNVYVVTVQVSDGRGGIDTQTISVTVTDVDETVGPIARDDVANTVQNSGPITIDVLANDEATDGGPLVVVTATQPANGLVVVLADGSAVTYQPDAGFSGTDTFTYTVEDQNGNTATATVTVFVREADNTAPIAVDDFVTVAQDSPATPIDVLANDSDPDGDPLRIALVTQPANGTVVITGNGTGLTYQPAAGFVGTETFTYTIEDGRGGSSTATVTVRVLPGTPFNQNQVDTFAVGSGVGGDSRVRLYGPNNELLTTLNPFPNAPNGTRVAVADVTGDGVPDIIVGTGPGVPTQVVVIDGVTRQVIASIQPFEASFTGGVFVSAGDLDGDGIADIAITPDEGGGPRVRIFKGALGVQLADFFVIEDPSFRGGARVAMADLNGDGISDILGAAGFLGGPRVALWNGVSVLQGITTGNAAKFTPDFFVFEQTLRNGVFITGGDITGDGFDDLIVGGGPGGGPRVFGLSGRDLVNGVQTQVANFFAGDISNRGGIRLAVKDLDGDGRGDLITASGTDTPGRISVYSGSSIEPFNSPAAASNFFPFDADFQGGLFVG